MEAKCSACRRALPAGDFHRDASRPKGVASRCKDCAREYQKAWYQQNKPSRDAQKRAYKEKNAESVLAASKQYYQRTKEEQREKNRRRYLKNRESILARQRDRYRKTYRENPAAIAAKARARALKIRNQYAASPAGIRAEIDGIYFFTSIFEGLEVDHIIPMKHDRVCGLHLPQNLQVIPAQENRRKGNRFTASDFKREERRLLAHAARMGWLHG